MAEAVTEVPEKVVARIGKQLAAYKTCPNKSIIVKLLKQAASAFGKLQQSKSLEVSVKPLSDSLVMHGLLDHKDKDVRHLVGRCLCEVLRVLAPNPDFSDAVSRDIFRFLLSMFGELVDTEHTYFSERAKMLETVAKLRFYLVMLDTGCEDLIFKMFKVFFSVDAAPDSFRLAESVIKHFGEKMEHSISQFLTSCILNRDAVDSVIKESYHEIIVEIYRIAPQLLLSVIPCLTHELLTDQVDVRIKALNLIRKLIASGPHLVLEYPNLFIELLNRFSDKSAEVRLAALSCAKTLYMTNPSGKESLKTLSAIQDRLLDNDDKVRIGAINVVCELSKINLNLTSSDLITQAAKRLRDKKVLVRRKALEKLIELYQEYCTRRAERNTLRRTEGNTLLNEHIEEIPCEVLMLCYEKDCQEFRPQSLDLVLADLFPFSLSIEEKISHWIFMFSLFKPPHLKALRTILSIKRRCLINLLICFISRRKLAVVSLLWLEIFMIQGARGYRCLFFGFISATYDVIDIFSVIVLERLMEILEVFCIDSCCVEAERKMEALVAKMASCFPDPAKAKDCFQKLKELKDNGVHSVLQQMLRKGTILDSEATKGVYFRELGDRKALSEFLLLLSKKCSLNIFGSEPVNYILNCLSGDKAEKKHLKNYQVQLLLTIISAFPSLLRGSEKQFQLLLLEREIFFNDQLVEMLAKEGYHLSIKLSDIYSSLEEICLEGTRRQAKLAVSAIATLASSSEQHIYSKLCKSLGCMAQHSVSTFEAQEKVIAHYIFEEIFQQNDVPASKDLDIFDEASNCCSSCKLKIFGLKALVRSFLPHKHTSLNRPISSLLGVILQMLQHITFFLVFSENDDAFIRLAAARSVLRLSRKWDLHISPEIFRLTILVAKENSPDIRRSFAQKINKLLKNHAVPGRYACAFSFVALDPLEDLRSDALKYLEEFVREYSKGVQIQEITTMQGAANHPLYLVVFLIHVLAHDPNFPAPDCRDEKTYAQFLSPLFVTVQALVNEHLVQSDVTLNSNASLYLRSIFSAIKKAEDAIDDQMTPKLHLLAEVGICILNSLNTNNTGFPHAPGLILLPSSLYKIGPSKMREA
ncbi:hypothetical protein MIMGU_mgv1a019419mg, partial [Erythranthe guttata]